MVLSQNKPFYHFSLLWCNFYKKDANSELLMLLLNLMLTLSFRHLLDSLMSSWWHLDTMLMTV